MISNNTLAKITKIVYPGATVYYTELQDDKDKSTISDYNGEISKALASNNAKDIGSIVQAIYTNAKYNGEIVNDKGNIKLVSNNKLYDVRVTNNGSVLNIKDTLNNKNTIIEYKKSKTKELKLSLQDQIILQFKKRKMSDKEVIEFIKNLEDGIK
jgi:hypothetical protein